MSLRVLCIGDSLTEGYTFEAGKGLCFYPYSNKLKDLLKSYCQDTVVVVDTKGVSGEQVVPSMVRRLDQYLKYIEEPYDWVIILGGTNDLGCGIEPDELLAHIIQLHERAKKIGARTMALSIPQFLYELNPGYEDYRSKKAKVNEGIKTYCVDSKSETLFVDLWNDLPFGTLPEEERIQYWVDGLHMTSKGYDKMAEVIFDSLKGNLR